MVENPFAAGGDEPVGVDQAGAGAGEGGGAGQADAAVGDRWPDYVPDDWFVRRDGGVVRSQAGDRKLAEFARTKIMHIRNCKGQCRPGMHDPVAQALIDDGYVYRKGHR